MKRIILSVFILALISIAFAQANHKVIAQDQSQPTYTFGHDPKIRLEVNMGIDEIKEINLRYRIAGDNAENLVYQKETMNRTAPQSSIWEARIPISYIKDNDIQYYFEFKLADLGVEIMPWEFDTNGPFLLTPGPQKGRIEEKFILLSQDDEIDQSDGFVFAVSFFEIADDLDLSSIRVWVGGKDVTKQSVVSDNTVVYRSHRNPGTVRGLVTAKMNGEEVQSPTWKAKSTQTKYPPAVDIFGKVNFSSNLYDYDIKDPANTVTLKAKSDWLTWGDITARYGRSSAFGSASLSSLEDPNQQRINRYTLGLRFPFLEMVAGDYSPNLSAFTMNNRNVYGLYGKLFSRTLSLEASAGEIVRKTMIPSTNPSLASYATYRQEALGARLRLGSENGFSVGFNGSRNRDIISSLDVKNISWADPATQDTLWIVNPKDNLVLSVDARLNMPEQNVLLGLEVAGSLLNDNTRDGAITSAEIQAYSSDLDFVNPEAFADIFVVNRNMQPFLPSLNNLAWLAYYRTYFWNNFFNISYSYAGSAFNALSTYYQQKDATTISITDHFLITRFLSVTGGFNLSTDNFSKTFAETNRNQSWFAQALFRIPRLPYLKAAYFDSQSTNKNNPDLQDIANFTPFKLRTQNLSAGIGYDFGMIPVVPSQLDITYRVGKNDKTQGINEDILFENFNNSINVSMTNHLMLLPLHTQFVFSLANQKRELPDISNNLNSIKDENYTLFAKVDYSLFKNKLVPSFSYHRVNLSGADEDQSFDYITLGIESEPLQNLTINTSVSQKYHRFSSSSFQDNDLFTWRLLLTQRF